jgi:hypothetical protein
VPILLASFLFLLPHPAGLAAQQPVPALPDTVAAPGDTLPGIDAAADPTERPLDAVADSVLQVLRALPGFTVTEYQGRTAVYDASRGVLRLEGDAEVVRNGDRLTADTIVYRERAQLVEAYGSPRVVGQAQELEGNVLFYDLERRRATALGARTQITEGATWFVRGDVSLEGTDRLFGRHAHFTSCDLEIPHYHFESDQIKVIRDRILVARPARLYFGNVPVMVLPFVVQNLERGRRSGFLTPRFGVHDVVRTSTGYNRQISDVGMYWAINQYMGAQLSTTWRSGAYTALLGDLEYNWRRQFLSGRVGIERYWQENGARELSFNTNSSWQPDERTSMGLSARYASSAAFVREASYDPREVTQDLNSSFSLSRRFGWGQASLGADRRQSIASGDVSATLPSFSLSPRSITLFRQPIPEQQRWFNNINFTPGVISGSRSTTDFADNILARRQDQRTNRFRVGPSVTVGNFSVNASADFNQAQLLEAAGLDRQGQAIVLPGFTRDQGSWATQASYRQSLIGTTNIAPNISLSQQMVRDTLTTGELLAAPVRLSFGTGLNTDLYGFFPGIGNFTAIRHRLSPRVGYSYAPEVEQTPLQERVFGRAGGRAQNRVSLGLSQTWEGKLRTPRPPEPSLTPGDTIAGDTIRQSQIPPVPSEPEKVTLLSLSTSAFEYDFIQAREEGSGFVTTMVSNSITSDYLRGLTIQMQHELFDRRDLDPADPATLGNLGTFAPRLSSLSTSFDLGPQTAIVQWLQQVPLRIRGRRVTEGILPTEPEDDEAAPAGQGAFTGNPQGMGAGPWRAGVSYQFTRPSRMFNPWGDFSDEAIQTLDGSMGFQLSPNWSVNWTTSYSLTDGQFGAHRLNFQRDLHEWQANFNFYQTPNGNTAFEFYVELLHNRDLRFDYAERNLGVDRRR